MQLADDLGWAEELKSLLPKKDVDLLTEQIAQLDIDSKKDIAP